MTDPMFDVFVGEKSGSLHPMLDGMDDIAAVDPASVALDERDGSLRMIMAGFHVNIVNGMLTSVPFEGAARGTAASSVIGIVRRMAHSIGTESRRRRARRLWETEKALRVRMLEEIGRFADRGYDDADTISTYARSPWGGRRTRIMRTDGVAPGGLTRSSTLPEWPDEPTACMLTVDDQVGRGLITIHALRVTVKDPWSVGPMGLMRMIAETYDPTRTDGEET